jgi:hypothetical protein
MATRVRTKSGKTFTLLTPAEKRRKHCKELKTGVNAFTGEVLSPRQKAWRAGYNEAGTDSARAYNAKNGLPGKGRSAVKKNGGKPTYPKRKGKGGGGSFDYSI